MTEPVEKQKRPTSITVICVVMLIGMIATVPMIFSQIAKQIGPWYPPFLGVASIIGFACMIGLWMMKKWAAYTYTGFVVLNQIVMLAMGVWNIMALLLPGIVIFFSIKNVSKMT